MQALEDQIRNAEKVYAAYQANRPYIKALTHATHGEIWEDQSAYNPSPTLHVFVHNRRRWVSGAYAGHKLKPKTRVTIARLAELGFKRVHVCQYRHNEP